MSWLKRMAAWNIFSMFTTLPTFQAPRSWLKMVAPWNILPILVTLLTSQLPIFWLKIEAPPNIPYISVTLLTFQLPKLASPLKDLAYANIPYISVTIERFGISVALLIRFSAPAKALFIEVQLLVPHCSMERIFNLSPPL